MNDTVPGFVVFIGGLVIAALIVSVGFFIYNNQKETSDVVVEQTNRINNQLQEAEWTQYNGTEITGSEVVNVIKRLQDTDTFVSVDNGNGEVFYIYSDASLNTRLTNDEQAAKIKEAKKRGSTAYINPSTKFYGQVERDANTEGILGIKFVKASMATTP